jgi:hypothetical protein
MTSLTLAVDGLVLMMRYKERLSVKLTVMADALKSSVTPVERTWGMCLREKDLPLKIQGTV